MVKEMSFDHLAIYLTEKCNLACEYCYIKKDYQSTLSFPVLKQALDFFQGCSTETKSYTFLGGEPLLVYSLVKKTISYINEINKKDASRHKIILFTNGVLLTRSKAIYLDKKGVQIVVSLDGKEDTNDRFRHFSQKSGYSVAASVVKNLEEMPLDILKKIEINAVVTPETCERLFDNVFFFYQKGICSITPSLTVYGQWSKKSYEILEAQLWCLARFYIGLFEKKKQLFKIGYLESLLKNFCSQMSTCNRVTLGTDGGFYLCDAFLSLTPSRRKKYRISGQKNASADKLKKWIERCKTESEKELKKITPVELFRLHKESKALYCPLGIYHYAKVNGFDPRPYMKDFFKISHMYTSIFWWIKERLKTNKDFLELYA